MSDDLIQFTVVVVTFGLFDNLLKIAKHLQRSAYIGKIIFTWNNFRVSSFATLPGSER